MAYEIVNDFAAGLDLRKSPLTAPGGTLTTLINAVVNPGGEIEKRRAFVKVADVPGSFGLASTGTTMSVFGRNVKPANPVLTPDGTALAADGTIITTIKIPNADPSLQMTDYDTFDGKLYLACSTGVTLGAKLPTKPTPAQNPHYYDAVYTEGSGKGFYVRTYQSKVYAVTSNLLSFSVVSNPALWNSDEQLEGVPVINMTNAKPPVVTVDPTNISKFTEGGAVAISGSSGTGMAIDGVHNISSVNSPANTFRLTYADTSTATQPQTSGITATPAILADLSNANPAVVTVSAADIAKFNAGSTIVGYHATGALAVANGKHQIANINPATYTFTLDVSTAAATVGTTDYVVTLDSGLPRSGAGYINLSLQDAAAETLTSLEVYYDKLAVFTTESVQIWAVDPDPAQNAFTQLLRDAGTSAPRSPLQYGSGDVLYLDRSGVRSLKARDSSNSAAVSDIGSPIDPFARQLRIDHGNQFMNLAISLLEPSIGRFWMIFPDRVMALSYFPGPGITAWSELTIPEISAATVTHAVACGGRIFIRTSADQVWVYGGADGNTYNNCGVEIRLPYLAGKKPGHNKLFEAIDMSIEGTWEVRISYDFNNPESEEVVGTFSQSTWNSGRAELTGYASHASLRFYNTDSGYCSLSNIALHYQVLDDEQ